MSKHTPGPWDSTTRQGSWDWVVFQQRNPNHEICQMFHDNTEFNETGEANSRLVAASPAMLEALKGAMVIIDSYLVPEGMSIGLQQAYKKRRNAILEAIALAEGRMSIASTDTTKPTDQPKA